MPGGHGGAVAARRNVYLNRKLLMSRAALLLATVLLAAAPTPVAAQTQGQPGASSIVAPPGQATQARRPRAFTGLATSVAVSVDASGAATPAYPFVRTVEPNSPGHQAGILPGDVIIEINGRDSREQRALWLEPGVRYTLRVRTGEQERDVLLTPLPPRDQAPAPAP